MASSATKIEWTDATWNPLRGCSRVSEGCRHCYAEKVAARFSKKGQAYEGLAHIVGGEARWTGKLRLVDEVLRQPLHWRTPRRIFVNSMSDLFHENVSDEAIDLVFAAMAMCPQHTFQVLTKRAKRMHEYFAERWQPAPAQELEFEGQKVMVPAQTSGEDRSDRVNGAMNEFLDPGNEAHWNPDGSAKWPGWPLPNVWLGVSVENQDAADERIPELLATPAAVRFLSCEPLLEPIDLNRIHETFDEGRAHCWESCLNGRRFDIWSDATVDGYPKIDWVICGGESGCGARPMHPDWARSLRDQCVAAGVPFFFKQWGEYIPHSCAPFDHQGAHTAVTFGKSALKVGADVYWKAGKKASGRHLDGRTWDEFPKVAS